MVQFSLEWICPYTKVLPHFSGSLFNFLSTVYICPSINNLSIHSSTHHPSPIIHPSSFYPPIHPSNHPSIISIQATVHPSISHLSNNNNNNNMFYLYSAFQEPKDSSQNNTSNWMDVGWMELLQLLSILPSIHPVIFQSIHPSVIFLKQFFSKKKKHEKMWSDYIGHSLIMT